jgi:hypothetical protein
VGNARKNHTRNGRPELRLNLGAGKVIFPLSEKTKSHPLIALPDTSECPDWVNVDQLPLAGIQETCDLFAYPFQWMDNSIDEIWLSHVAEHIPHAPRFNEMPDVWLRATGDYDYQEAQWYKRWHELKNLDGFYCFFAECWRILKPNARLTVIAPYGKSDGALQDPQHTRFIVESTFHYLGGGAIISPTYDYQLPFEFRTERNPVFRLNGKYGGLPENDLYELVRTCWNIADQIQVELFAVK